MRQRVDLKSVLATSDGDFARRLALFTLLAMGLIESLANGVISGEDAVRLFFHAENCLFVKKHLRAKEANEIMSRGAQLPDLFEALSAEEARREFLHELAAMRALCLKLLEDKRPVA